MLRMLNEEGFEIKERELMRVRAKNRWLLRVPNGMKSASYSADQPHTDEETLLALQQEVYAQDDEVFDADNAPPQTPVEVPRAASPGLSPEVIAKRKRRLEQLQSESAERWASRKRRRRTRGWAGLPADPPGPPRFPSETTIDESKTYLSLDNNLYRELRDHFQRICEEAGFVKKTTAGPEKWQAAKDRLIAESPHLQSVFWSDNTNVETKTLALDVVCTDVTKRMRTLERRMTIAEAKNALGINPEESRQVRNAFYQTLKNDHFTSKLEAGDDHWKELKQSWIDGSELLKGILAPGDADPEHATKVKAMEVLCRDVMKRLRDDQTKRDPAHKSTATTDINPSNGISNLASQALASTSMITNDISDMQIDPSLLQAANDPSITIDQASENLGYPRPMMNPTVPSSTPVYFRLHPESNVKQVAKMWLGTLQTRSIAELRQLANSKYPNANVARIEGTEKDINGQDINYVLDEDDELDAYLTHVQGRKATFVVLVHQL
jgi:hypothetical protein